MSVKFTGIPVIGSLSGHARFMENRTRGFGGVGLDYSSGNVTATGSAAGRNNPFLPD
jgi:hypothetical protein